MRVYNKDLYVGGEFTQVGGATANYIAKWNEPLGIKEERINIESVSIFPNPCSRKLNMKNEGKYLIKDYSLFSPDGKEISLSYSTTTEIDLSNVPPGFYFLKIQTSEGILVKKVVVEK